MFKDTESDLEFMCWEPDKQHRTFHWVQEPVMDATKNGIVGEPFLPDLLGCACSVCGERAAISGTISHRCLMSSRFAQQNGLAWFPWYQFILGPDWKGQICFLENWHFPKCAPIQMWSNNARPHSSSRGWIINLVTWSLVVGRWGSGAQKAF